MSSFEHQYNSNTEKENLAKTHSVKFLNLYLKRTSFSKFSKKTVSKTIKDLNIPNTFTVENKRKTTLIQCEALYIKRNTEHKLYTTFNNTVSSKMI